MKKYLCALIILFTTIQKSNAGSVSVEADVLAYGLNGYSAILRKTFDGGLEVAIGGGRFDMPKFVIESEQDNYDEQKWTADCTSIQVLRIGYRFSKPNEDGLSTHLIAMKQDWTVKSRVQNAKTDYTTINTGISFGYTYHIGKRFYLYPTAAYTFNSVRDGKAEVGGVKYDVPSSGANGSLHAGFEF